MRFINTHRFSPVANKEDLPWEHDYFHVPSKNLNDKIIEESIIDEEWWFRQRERCLEGYEVEMAVEKGGEYIVDGVDALWYGDDVYLPEYDFWIRDRKLKITGRHYFYLNFWQIYGLAYGSSIKEHIAPRFLDIDFLFALRIERMQELQKDNQELKGRQMGVSEKGAGMVLAYNYTFIHGSLNIIIGAIEDDAKKTMKDAKRGLDNLLNTQFYKKRSIGGNSESFLEAANTLSQIHCLTAKDNPQTASRFSPFWVWYEEIGKGKKEWSIKTSEFVKPSIEAEGGKKTGFQHFIGTGGEMEDGVFDLMDRHYKPDEYNILAFNNQYETIPHNNKVGHFMAKDLFYHIDKDGNSFRESSREAIRKERAALSPTKRYYHTTQFPLYASEVFYRSSGGFFRHEQVQLINERISYINNHRDSFVEKRGNLKWKDIRNKHLGVIFEANESGEFYIFEHPEENKDGKVPFNLYFAGTDSYDQDESAYTNSLGATSIWKNFLNADTTYRKWVARILQRPTVGEGGAERFFENTALLCAYYNARNLIEFSKWRIIDWYVKNGCEWLLKERPEAVLASFINNTKATNRWGIDPSTKKDWLNILRDDLTPELIEKMDDVVQLGRLASFRYDPSGKKYNCDFTIATALSRVHQKDEDEYAPIYEEEKNNKTMIMYYSRDAHGNIVRQFKPM